MAYFTMNDMAQAASVLATALERDPGVVELAPMLAASYARLGQREEARAALQLWRPDASQSELRELVRFYHFPYTWSGAREPPERLAGGLEIAALPKDVTVESLIVTLGQVVEISERESAARTLGLFGPAAKAAVPILQELLDDPALKYAAKRALKKINGN